MATNELINNKPINLENLSLALSAIKADYINRIKDNQSLFCVYINESVSDDDVFYICSHTRKQCRDAWDRSQLVYVWSTDTSVPLFYDNYDCFWGIDLSNSSLVRLFFQTGNDNETLLDFESIPLVTGPYPTEAEMEEMLQEMGFVNPLISNYDNAIYTELL